MNFGETLIEARKSKDIGRRKLNELTGLSLSYLHEIENDVFLPSAEKLAVIADALGLKGKAKADLLRGRDEAELEREGFKDADVTLLLKDRKGPLPDDAKQQIVDILGEVQQKERDRRAKRTAN